MSRRNVDPHFPGVVELVLIAMLAIVVLGVLRW